MPKTVEMIAYNFFVLNFVKFKVFESWLSTLDPRIEKSMLVSRAIEGLFTSLISLGDIDMRIYSTIVSFDHYCPKQYHLLYE